MSKAKKVILTPGEMRIFKLVVEGLSNKEIGGALSLTEASVKGMVTRIFRKCSVESRAQLIVRHYLEIFKCVERNTFYGQNKYRDRGPTTEQSESDLCPDV